MWYLPNMMVYWDLQRYVQDSDGSVIKDGAGWIESHYLPVLWMTKIGDHSCCYCPLQPAISTAVDNFISVTGNGEMLARRYDQQYTICKAGVYTVTCQQRYKVKLMATVAVAASKTNIHWQAGI